MEKFIERPRHIEFQVLADKHGNVVSLGERECSIQRRHQKLLEESPSVKVTPEMRREIGDRLVSALSRIGYVNAGTVEFLMDEDGSLTFMEMNTRIQVEHPVTEMVTGIDLVKSQILIAAGERLDAVLNGDRIERRGHAIECRINAEHPETFIPSAGKIKVFNAPGGTGVRLDTAAYTEAVIPAVLRLVDRQVDRARQGPQRSDLRAWRAPWRCSSSRGSIRRSPCTARSWPTLISAPGISTPSSWSDFWRSGRRQTVKSLLFERGTASAAP